MRQHNIRCVCVCSIWRGMPDSVTFFEMEKTHRTHIVLSVTQELNFECTILMLQKVQRTK